MKNRVGEYYYPKGGLKPLYWTDGPRNPREKKSDPPNWIPPSEKLEAELVDENFSSYPSEAYGADDPYHPNYPAPTPPPLPKKERGNGSPWVEDNAQEQVEQLSASAVLTTQKYIWTGVVLILTGVTGFMSGTYLQSARNEAAIEQIKRDMDAERERALIELDDTWHSYHQRSLSQDSDSPPGDAYNRGWRSDR